MISPAREAGLLGSKGSALALQRPCATPPISALPDGRLPPNSLFNTGPSPFPSGLGSGSPSTNLTSAASRLHPSPVTNQEQPIWGSGGGGGRTESGGLLGVPSGFTSDLSLQAPPVWSPQPAGSMSGPP